MIQTMWRAVTTLSWSFEGDNEVVVDISFE